MRFALQVPDLGMKNISKSIFETYQIQDFHKPQKYNFKSQFPILFKSFFLRPEMVFNRENYFIVSKIFDKNLEKLNGHILSIYKSFNTWSCSKYWTKPPKTISAHFKDLKYFYRKYFHKNPRKIQQVTNAYCDHLAKPHVN